MRFMGATWRTGSFGLMSLVIGVAITPGQTQLTRMLYLAYLVRATPDQFGAAPQRDSDQGDTHINSVAFRQTHYSSFRGGICSCRRFGFSCISLSSPERQPSTKVLQEGRDNTHEPPAD